MTTTPYVPDYLRCQAPANSTERAAFWKRRAPLGDAEFYYEVCPDIGPNLEYELYQLIGEMQKVFAAGKSLTRYRSQVREWLREYRQSKPWQGAMAPALTDSASLQALNRRSNADDAYWQVQPGAPERIHAQFRASDAQRAGRAA